MLEYQKGESGFTIIETLIVLAIASIMLTIIFYAIPTLQRNGRNNQRKQDIQAILEIVSRYELNNSGAIPSQAELDTKIHNAKLTFYDTGNVLIVGKNAGDTVSPQTDTEKLSIYNHQKCDGNQVTPNGAGFNDIVGLYAIETGGGTVAKCQEL